MRACTQRLPWRTRYLRPMTAASVSSQASVAPKRCAGSSVSGVPIQSPRDTSSWRSSTRPTDWPASACPPRWPARRSATHRGAFAARETAAPHRRRARGPARCAPTACAAGGRCRRRRGSAARVPRTAPAAAARRRRAPARSGRPSSTCSSDGPRYQGASSGCVMLSPRSADTGTTAATAMPASRAKASSAPRTASKAGLRLRPAHRAC